MEEIQRPEKVWEKSRKNMEGSPLTKESIGNALEPIRSRKTAYKCELLHKKARMSQMELKCRLDFNSNGYFWTLGGHKAGNVFFQVPQFALDKSNSRLSFSGRTEEPFLQGERS